MRMVTSGFTLFTEVVIVANRTLVSDSCNIMHLASITGIAFMYHLGSFLLGLLHNFGLVEHFFLNLRLDLTDNGREDGPEFFLN